MYIYTHTPIYIYIYIYIYTYIHIYIYTHIYTPLLVQGEESDIVVASLVRSNARNNLGFLGKADAEKRALHVYIYMYICRYANPYTPCLMQGEESDIVVASLVRSNARNILGFLGKADAEKRLNVLCARARLGLILIGNAQCLETAPHWAELLTHLRAHSSVSSGLPAKCQVLLRISIASFLLGLGLGVNPRLTLNPQRRTGPSCSNICARTAQFFWPACEVPGVVTYQYRVFFVRVRVRG